MVSDPGPLVSVVVPAFNAERTLRRTLDSALGQTWRNIEVVVVDDGSTDGTAAIATEAARKDRRIRVLHQRNAGVAAARNRAIATAEGALLAPLDADDLWHPRYLELQLAALDAAGPPAVLSYAWWVAIDGRDRVTAVAPPLRPRSRRAALRRLVCHNFVGNGSAAVMRRAAVLAVGGYDASLRARGAEGCEDMALYLALAGRGAVACAGRYLVGYRRHDGAMSNAVVRMQRSEQLVRDDAYARRTDLPQSWRRLARARHHQRALWQAARHGRPSEAWRALRATGADGLGMVALALGWWGPIGLAEALATLPALSRGWLGCDLTELWGISAPACRAADLAPPPSIARHSGPAPAELS